MKLVNSITFPKSLLALCLTLVFGFFSACTPAVIETLDGGHSPMMILDGHWNIDLCSETTNGVTYNAKDGDQVWFNATKDIGGYCEGTWLETNNGDEVFLWGIDGDATEWTQKQDGNDILWNVLEQDKHTFIIERTENGTLYRMEFSK